MEMSAGKTCIRECDNLTRFDKGRNRDGGGGGGGGDRQDRKDSRKKAFYCFVFHLVLFLQRGLASSSIVSLSLSQL